VQSLVLQHRKRLLFWGPRVKKTSSDWMHQAPVSMAFVFASTLPQDFFAPGILADANRTKDGLIRAVDGGISY
jgi:hypothetical protein